MMTRDEHIAWCKQQALKYLDRGDATGAIMSMVSDVGKHPETERHPGNMMAIGLLAIGGLKSADEVRNFIEGYN